MVTNIRRNWLIYLALVALTLVVYSRVTGFQFIYYDDDTYVFTNEHVKAGLTIDGLRWSLSPTKDGNWIPLTWASLMLDHEMSKGLSSVRYEGREDPTVYHRTNLLLHLANTLLLFAVLNALTGFRWRSAMVAALFAVHPLHVESVAWIAERKDVLSAFFMMLTLLAYAWFARRPNAWRYLAVALLFALGLMSKSMLVSLPLVMLMLDFWPLRRVAGWTSDNGLPGRRWGRLVIEKLPLLAMSAAVGAATFIAQRHGEAVRTLTDIPMGARVANAAVSYVAYLWKTVWPANLACIYPHPGSAIPTWQVIGSGSLLVGLTIGTVLMARRRPCLAVGWFWYVVMLVPVIGIVQVGEQAMADRYTYITLIGIFIALVWGVSETIPRTKARVPILAVIATAVLVPLTVRAYSQVGYWRDNQTLFGHAVEATSDNYLANYYLANAYLLDGHPDESLPYYRESIRINPTYAVSHSNLGVVYAQKGDVRLARREFEIALRLDPDSLSALTNLARIAAMDHRPDLALRHLERAHRVAPEDTAVTRAIDTLRRAKNRPR